MIITTGLQVSTLSSHLQALQRTGPKLGSLST